MKIFSTFILLITPILLFANDSVIELGEKIFNDHRFSKNKSVSCATCHMIDEQFDELGMRAYNDFQARTPLDSDETTLRNTPSLVGIGSRYSRNNLSHADGELTHEQTYLGNFTGVNMGWAYSSEGLVNALKVLRDSEYRDDFKNLPADWSFDIESQSDAAVLEHMVKIGTAYLFDLDFETDDQGEYIGSPYDQFLKLNGIDRGPKDSESNHDYTVRLRNEIIELKSPNYVPARYFETQRKSLGFGESEFRGLKTFFNIEKRGMCINCHTAPLFTDQAFHNIGVSQREYDLVHGENSFNRLAIPSLSVRNRDNTFFLSIPTKADEFKTDLGVWNFFARKDKKLLNESIRNDFCSNKNNCNDALILDLMVARFKTPSLRNLGMSQPYFHNGSMDTLGETLVHYEEFSNKARAGTFRNMAPQMRMMNIKGEAQFLEAFLKSLNEDYD